MNINEEIYQGQTKVITSIADDQFEIIKELRYLANVTYGLNLSIDEKSVPMVTDGISIIDRTLQTIKEINKDIADLTESLTRNVTASQTKGKDFLDNEKRKVWKP